MWPLHLAFPCSGWLLLSVITIQVELQTVKNYVVMTPSDGLSLTGSVVVVMNLCDRIAP